MELFLEVTIASVKGILIVWTIMAFLDALFQKHNKDPKFEKNFATKMLRGYLKTKWIVALLFILFWFFIYQVSIF